METTHQVLNTNNNNNNNQTLEISQVLTTPQSQDSGSPDDRISNHVYAFYILSKWLNVILITVITVTGLYGNTMSLRLFLRKFLNKKTQQKLTIYFLLLSLSDMLVLALHYVDFTFRSWVNLLDAHSSSEFNFVDKCLLCCKLLPYLRNVFRTVSVYTLLILTVQRFIVLYFPLVRSKFLSLRFNESLIVGLVMFALCLSMGNLFMNDLVPHKETQQNFCSVDERFVHVQFAVDVVFVSLTIIFPTLFIFIFSIILFLEIRRNLPDQSRAALVSIRSNSKTNSTNGNGTINGLSVKRANSGDMFTLDTSTEMRKEQNRASGTIGNVGGCGSETNSRTGCMVTTPMLACHHHNGNSQQQAETIELKFKNKLNHTIRTTYMLVLLSKWFVIFHVPYFVCWAIYHIYVNQPTKTSTTTSDRSSPLLTPHYNMTSSMLSSSASSSSSSSSSSPFSNDLDPNTILTIRGFLNLFEILFLFNYTVHFFLYLFNIPSFKRAHANEVKRFLKKIGFCIKN